MPETVAAQLAAQAVLLEHISSRMEEDRQERKAAQAETERIRLATSTELTAMRQEQNDVMRRLDNIEPFTDLVASWRGKLAGIMIVMGFIGALATFIIVFFKDAIMRLFQ